MGLLDDLKQRIEAQLLRLLSPVIDPIKKLWGTLKGFFTAIIDLVPESIALVKLVLSEVEEWRSFREQINFRTGVINLPKAIEATQSVLDDIVAAWDALKHLFTDGFKKSITQPLDAAAEAATELAEVFGGLEKLGLKGLEDIVPKLKKAGGKVFEVLAIIQLIAESLLDVVKKLSAIVNALKDIREEIETGSTLFLQQKNKRKVVTTMDGDKIRLRIGKLHSN